MAEKVVRCDLRPHSQPYAALKEVYRLLNDKSEPDITLLMVIDTPQTLATHVPAYEELWRSRRVEKLLSVVVGPLMPRGDLEIPESVGTVEDSGIIWVGDPDGVNWALAGSTIASVHLSDSGDAGLSRLIDILSMPQVFRKTLSLIADIPQRVASPGMNVFEVSASQAMFLASLSRSIRNTLAPDATYLRARLDVSEEQAWTLDTVHSAVLPTGRLAGARDRCLAEAEELAETLDTLGTPAALYGTGQTGARARSLAIRAGTELSAYRTAVHELVGSSALERGDRLYDWGVRPVTASTPPTSDIAAAIDAAVRAGDPLPLVSLRLRDYERKVRAHGDIPYPEQIEQVSPRALEQRLAAPEPMPGPEPWLIAAGTVATAAAALRPGTGLIAGLAVALVWLGLLTLTVIRAPGGRMNAHTGSLVAGVIATILGLAAGTLIGRALHPVPVAEVTGFVAGLGLAILTTTWSWRVRTRRWRATLEEGDLARAVEGLTNIAVAAANREWSAGETRQDAMITAKATLDGATSALRAYQQKLDRDLARESARYTTRHEFDRFVSHGLATLVAEALGPVLRESHAGSPRGYEGRAGRRVEELLAEWESHVEGYGPLDLPEFVSTQELEVSVLTESDVATITSILTAEPKDTMWQLCQPIDIRLLDFSITKVPVIRFAPRTILMNVTSALPAETEWIGSTGHAGVLRLVPLRQGVAHRTWLTNEGPADAESAGDQEDGHLSEDHEEDR